MRCLMAIALLLAGCQNECQQICLDMADYAESDCDKTFSEDQIDECLKSFADPTEKQLDNCATYGSRISEEWSCEDIGDYFKK